MPGVLKPDIKLHLKDNVLTIQAERVLNQKMALLKNMVSIKELLPYDCEYSLDHIKAKLENGY